MRIEGTLAKWNDDRGFGFIKATHGGPEVFVHISVFPRDGSRPRIGERLTFEIEIDNGGRKRAKNLVCSDRQCAYTPRSTASHHRPERKSFLARIAPLAVFLLIVYGYSQYSRRGAPQESAVAQPIDQASFSSPFRCDGRTSCGQMSSCAEATFFLQNCPNVKMDGNHDGVPCEQQWCSSRR